jgi:ubiquinol oxidase
MTATVRMPPEPTLRDAQQETLRTPRLDYGLPASILFLFVDTIYGRARSISKFKVLEVLARVPYQSWEHAGYIAVTNASERPLTARRMFDDVESSRHQQDNEQWHLLILEELTRTLEVKESFLRHRVVPRMLAMLYYQLSLVLYLLRPAWSQRLNADFEDHAEHEYALFVEEHPEFEDMPFDSHFVEDYGHFASLADLFRQIGRDERQHKEASLAAMAKPRLK